MIPRAIGETFPISVATAIPFEKLKDYEDLKKYNSIYINISTLIRNAHGCMEVDSDEIKPDDLYEAVDDDIHKLATILSNHFDNLSVTFYFNTNKKLSTIFPYSKRVIPKTTKQIAYAKISKEVSDRLRKQYAGSIVEYNTFITPPVTGKTGIILTCFCTELLSANRFKHLVLLESYTGAIKGMLEWNTKLTNGQSLLNIPFCKFSLSVFGDNNRNIVALPKEFRNAVKELAKKGKWTANSTITKMKFTISNYADPHSKKQLLKLF